MLRHCICWIGLLLLYVAGHAQAAVTDSLLAAGEAKWMAVSRNKGTDAALKAIENDVHSYSHHPVPDRIKLLLRVSDVCVRLGRYTPAYDYGIQAKALLAKWPGAPAETVAAIETHLSTCAQRAGNITLSTRHTRNAYNLLAGNPRLSPERLYRLSSAMGASMWYAAKNDSAYYYYSKALEAVALIDSSPLNRFYRPALIKNNIAGVYGQDGKSTEAIGAMRDVIRLTRLYLASGDTLKKDDGLEMELEAFDNLAGIYKTLGDYTRAQRLLEFSFARKQQRFEAGTALWYKSKILLGQLYVAQHQYEKAEQYLLEGLAAVRQEGGPPNFFEADACNGLASLYVLTGNTEKAAAYYTAGDKAYQAAQEGSFDDIYLEFLRRAARFYAEADSLPRARQFSAKANSYVKSLPQNRSLLVFHQQLNNAELEYAARNWKPAAEQSARALETINRRIAGSRQRLDSVMLSLQKPRAMMIHAGAVYQALPKKDSAHLLPVYEELRQAMQWLELRKTILLNSSDLNLLLEEHRSLRTLLKTVALELYEATGSEHWLYELVMQHESGIYNRIRDRLNQQDVVAFRNMPPQVLAEEQSLKKKLQSAAADSTSIDDWLGANEQWQSFLQRLQKNHPGYYRLRYASIMKSPAGLLNNPPPQTTLVRYFFTGSHLCAVVADQQQKKLFRLDSTGIARAIDAISQPGITPAAMSGLLHLLYNQLWAPLSSAVHHRKLVIIPDDLLYKLSFELLTPQPVGSFKELSDKALLAQYAISYRYSLLQQDEDSGATRKANFIAFVPGFEQNEPDSLFRGLDDGYAQLLPLPFSYRLAEKARRWFGGETFLRDACTAANFMRQASNHRILHIGTHAEFDDLHPSYSRLIFSRQPGDSSDGHAVYLHQLYDFDLQSDLSVLTACESGRAGYADGEGMLSMAHAFHYAGSRSMLTGLWKIDDQASAEIIASFYRYLQKGETKPEALRRAKLDYLAHAEGRTTAPVYWAGLVIMGDEAPLQFESAGLSPAWWLLLLPVLGYAVVRLRKNRTLVQRRNSLN